MTRLALWLIAWIVPRARRADWRREWHAEAWHQTGVDVGSSPAAPRLPGTAVIAEALSHAIWLRRLEWSFAMKDLRFALRMLVRQPLLSTVIVATLALGIGGVTTMFSIVHGVMLRPLPYDEPDDLVWMYGAFRHNDSAAISPPDFLDYRAQNDAFSSLGAMLIAPFGVTVSQAGEPERMQATWVSAGLITTLGVLPTLGRDFTAEEESLAGPQAVVLSHRTWRTLFSESPDVIGRSIVVDGRPRTIVGIMPAGFDLPYDPLTRAVTAPDFYLPLPFDSDDARVRRFHYLRAIGRLQPGVTIQQAQERMDVIARGLEAVYPENETWRLRLLPLHEQLVGDVRPLLFSLFAAVACVLLISCANIASLLLARATARQHEIAIRMALGASRARVVRQLLVEGLTLSLAGGAAGLVVAGWTLEVLRRTEPGLLPRLSTVAIDPVVIAAALATTIGATLLFALAPALAAARPASAGLRDEARAGQQPAGLRLRQTLVAGQVALSLMLLIGAGLLARSLLRLESIDFGFDTDDVLLAQISLPPESYPLDRVEPFFTALASRLNTIPGIEAAALATSPPLVGGNDTAVHRPEAPPATPADRRFTQIRWIQGHYFKALGVPLLSGRLLDDEIDGPGAQAAVVVSRQLTEQFFPGENPVGLRLVIDLQTPITAEIVGVVADTRVFGQGVAPPPLLYMSARQAPTNFMNVIVRTALGEDSVARSLRATVRELDARIALDRIQRMDALAIKSVSQPRFSTRLSSAFSAVALAMTLVGLYGMLSYAVSIRRREFGIRLALGARASQVVGMVLRQGAVVVAVGTVIGLAGALMASRLLAPLLFEVEPDDPVVFGVVTLCVCVVALVAVALPARRAARVDPVTALRAD